MLINFACGFAVPEKALEFGVLIVAVAWIGDWQQGTRSEQPRSSGWCRR
jgi:hypothetical protein